MRGRLAAIILAIVTLSASTTAQVEPPLGAILERAGAYVLAFDARFSNVVSEERYIQNAVSTGVGGGSPSPHAGAFAESGGVAKIRRELVSDFLLVRTPAAEIWIPFRDVFEVDGKPVRNRGDRLTKLFLQPPETAIQQAQRIVGESARYNIGLNRTINIPVLALAALRPTNQPRFTFKRGGEDKSIGPGVFVIEYREHATPTIITGLLGRDMFAHGRFWIEAATGRIVRTELLVEDVRLRASIATRYRRDEIFNLDVPYEMREEYILANGSRVDGVATYGNFRKFDVSVDTRLGKSMASFEDKSSGLSFVEIPAGTFVMGSPAAEQGRRPDEIPHEVVISKSFLLGRDEITQEQWLKFAGTSPSHFTECGPRCPVENVSYLEVQEFLDRLNASGSALRVPPADRSRVGCTRAAPVRRRLFQQGRTSQRSRRTTTAISPMPSFRQALTVSTQRRPARFRSTRGACPTCTGTSGNGRRTGTVRTAPGPPSIRRAPPPATRE